MTLITVDSRSPHLSQPTDRGRRGHRGGRGRSTGFDMDFFPGLVSGNTLSFNTIVHDLSTRPGYDPIRQRLSDGVPDGLPAEWFSPQDRTIDAIAQNPVVAGQDATLDLT